MTVLAICAALYGVAGSLSSLLQAAALVRAGSAREISIPFIAILTGGHAIWLAYGVGITNLPLIVTDSIGLGCGLVTWITALRLSGTVDQRQRMRQECVDQAFTDPKVIAGDRHSVKVFRVTGVRLPDTRAGRRLQGWCRC